MDENLRSDIFRIFLVALLIAAPLAVVSNSTLLADSGSPQPEAPLDLPEIDEEVPELEDVTESEARNREELCEINNRQDLQNDFVPCIRAIVSETLFVNPLSGIGSIGKLLDSSGEIIKEVLKGFSDSVEGIGSGLKEIDLQVERESDRLRDQAAEYVTGSFETTARTVGKVVDLATDAISRVTEVLIKILVPIANGIEFLGESLVDLVEAIVGIIQAGIDLVEDFLEWIGDSLEGVFDAFQWLIDWISAPIEFIENRVESITSGIEELSQPRSGGGTVRPNS